MAIRGIRLDVCRVGWRAGIIDEGAIDPNWRWQPGNSWRQERAEIAVAKGVTWESEPVEAAAAIINPQNVTKKERLVLDDRSAERPTIIIVGGASKRVW